MMCVCVNDLTHHHNVWWVFRLFVSIEAVYVKVIRIQYSHELDRYGLKLIICVGLRCPEGQIQR